MDDSEIANHFTIGVEGRVGEAEMGELVMVGLHKLNAVVSP